MEYEDFDFRLRKLDGQLEEGVISFAEHLKALHDLIGAVLTSKDEQIIVTLALHLQPALEGRVGRRSFSLF